VARPQKTEVAAIQRREFRLIESFDDGEDGRIHEADVRVGIPIAKLPNARVVRDYQVDDHECARFDVAQQRHERTRMEAPMDPVVDFDEDWRRDDQLFVGGLDQSTTSPVIRVGPVEGRVQRSGVEDQRHARGSGRSSALRRAVSDVPEAPIPRLLGFGASRSTFSSIASLMMVAIETPLSAAMRRRRRRTASSRESVVRFMVA